MILIVYPVLKVFCGTPGCFSLHENNLQSSDKIKYNLIGQHSGNNYFFQYFKSNGRLIKKIISNE